MVWVLGVVWVLGMVWVPGVVGVLGMVWVPGVVGVLGVVWALVVGADGGCLSGAGGCGGVP